MTAPIDVRRTHAPYLRAHSLAVSQSCSGRKSWMLPAYGHRSGPGGRGASRARRLRYHTRPRNADATASEPQDGALDIVGRGRGSGAGGSQGSIYILAHRLSRRLLGSSSTAVQSGKRAENRRAMMHGSAACTHIARGGLEAPFSASRVRDAAWGEPRIDSIRAGSASSVSKDGHLCAQGIVDP